MLTQTELPLLRDLVNVTGAEKSMEWVHHIDTKCISHSVNDTGAEKSMTWVHHIDTKCISLSVNVTGADSQCHGCISILSVNHTQSMSQVQIVNVMGAY